MFNRIYDNVDYYKKSLDGIWERHKAITNNIANENTPNYKRKVVSFEEELKRSVENNKINLKTTHKDHLSKTNNSFSPRINEDKSLSYRIDGNNVNIDTETADLAKNTIMYDAMIKQISGEFEKIKNVITEGSK